MAALALAACAAVGPNYRPPTASVPAAFSGPGAGPGAGPASDGQLAAWWREFRDPTLDDLIARAVAGNLDVKTAISRIRQARDQERIAGAAALPSLNASGQASETHLSKNAGLGSVIKGLSGGGGQTPIGLPGTSFANYQAGFDAAWEVDVFGGVRRAVEAARADTAAQQWSARDAEVSLTAEVASDYLTLREAQARLGIAQATLAAAEDNLGDVQARARNGLATVADVSQRAAQAADAAAQAPPLRAQIDAQVHALGVLLGQSPESLRSELSGAASLPSAAPTVPAGLPSDLLRRRPDIRAAERRLASASAQIGVATADLYPSFSLTSAGDLVSASLKTLVSADSLQGDIAGVIRWPIFDGGRVRANIAAKREADAQAAIAYQRTVLTALKDVEDALSRYDADRRRRDWLDQTVSSDKEALEAAQARFDGGLAPFSTVLDARASLLAAQDQQTQSAAAAARDVASLGKALGGGWGGFSDPIVTSSAR